MYFIQKYVDGDCTNPEAGGTPVNKGALTEFECKIECFKDLNACFEFFFDAAGNCQLVTGPCYFRNEAAGQITFQRIAPYG